MCPFLVDPVIWNSRQPILLTVRLDLGRAYDEALVRLVPTAKRSYDLVTSGKDLLVVKPGSGGQIPIYIRALDAYAPDRSALQLVLGEIHLQLLIESVMTARVRRHSGQSFDDVVVSILSPFRHPLDDPGTSHVVEARERCKRLSRHGAANVLLKKIDGLKEEKSIVWLHGPPGCGKTSLLQDVQTLATGGLAQAVNSQWLPVLVHLTEANSAVLKSAWQFMCKIDDRIETAAQAALGLTRRLAPSSNSAIRSSVTGALLQAGGALPVDEAAYAHDPYLADSYRLHTRLAEELAKPPSRRILLIVDGFYYLEDIGPELYRNLLRLIHLLHLTHMLRLNHRLLLDSAQQAVMHTAYTHMPYTLLITDIMPFDERRARLDKSHADLASEWADLHDCVEDVPCPLLTSNEVGKYLQQFFSKGQLDRYSRLKERLYRCTTGGHPTLLKGVLQQAKGLYKNDAATPSLSLPRTLATELADRYEHLGVVTKGEREVWGKLLAGQNLRSALDDKPSHEVETSLNSLCTKGLAVMGARAPRASWPISVE